MRGIAWFVVCGAVAGSAAAAPASPVTLRVAGDSIPAPLTSEAGDAGRGRSVAMSRDASCLLCHAFPQPGPRPAGNLAPPLAGVGSRLTAEQLRLRIVDSQRLDANSIMPSYYRIEGLNQVAAAWRGKPILTAQQVEDVVAYLLTLR